MSFTRRLVACGVGAFVSFPPHSPSWGGRGEHAGQAAETGGGNRAARRGRPRLPARWAAGQAAVCVRAFVVWGLFFFSALGCWEFESSAEAERQRAWACGGDPRAVRRGSPGGCWRTAPGIPWRAGGRGTAAWSCPRGADLGAALPALMAKPLAQPCCAGAPRRTNAPRRGAEPGSAAGESGGGGGG